MNVVEVAAVQVVEAVTPAVSVVMAHPWIEVTAAQTVTVVPKEDTPVTEVMMTGKLNSVSYCRISVTF